MLLALAPTAPAASEGGPLTQRCRAISEALHGPCRGGEQLAADAAATCRWAGVPDSSCGLPLAPRVSAAAVARYRASWVHRALSLQYELGNDVPLRNAPWVGTHNSFNSVAEMGPTLSDLDSNQQLSLTDQLQLDVRSLELDLHWFLSARSGLARAPVVCHAEGNHAGCTVERELGPVLDEIAAWLRKPANAGQVLLLYLEDHLDGEQGYDAAAAALRERLGRLVYRPPGGGGCTELPLGLTRDDVLAAGAQVIIVSGCGAGAAWASQIFTWRQHRETRPVGYTDFPGCGRDFDRATYDSTIIRYFEDSTWLTAQAAPLGLSSTDDGITPATAAAMARCGVDLTGMDQLLPGDGRLASLVWSWAPGQPAAGDCAVQVVSRSLPYGRWQSRPCGERHPVACRAAGGAWSVATPAVPEAAAPALCSRMGASFAVPRTGYEAQLLRLAMQAAGAGEAWLAYRRAGATWAATGG